MKKHFKLLSIITVFILMFSFQSSFAHSENNNESSQGNNLTIPLDEINYEVNKNLTEEQVYERFEQINSTYNINEPFSLEDSEFVKAYATLGIKSFDNQLSDDIQLTKVTSQSFYKTKSAYGVKVSFSGTLYSTINILNHSYRGNVISNITAGSSKVKKITNTVTNVAYGILGNSGTYVGIVYNGSTSSGRNNVTRWGMDKTVKYSAVSVMYTHTNAYTTVVTSSGSFNLYGF